MKWLGFCLCALPLFGSETKFNVPPVEVEINLGKKRTSWNKAKWKVHQLEQVTSLQGHRGLELEVSTDAPRSDVGVYVALQESDGTWYSHAWACDLTQKKNKGSILFEDFFLPFWHAPTGGPTGHTDENTSLNLEEITAVAFGTVNPLGVDTVEFKVESLTPVAGERDPDTGPIALEVTGETLAVNGTLNVPAGLFGGFNLQSKKRVEEHRIASGKTIHFGGQKGLQVGKGVRHMMINNIFDRYQAALRFSHADWSEQLEKMGKAAANHSQKSSVSVYVEFWNEPYLNWSNRSRRNFDLKYFDTSKAKEGGPVHLRYSGEVIPHFKWTQNPDAPNWSWMPKERWVLLGRDAKGKVYKKNPPPEGVQEGETYTTVVKNKKKKTSREVTLTAFRPWYVYDETQHSYWSARGQLMPYIDMMEAYAKGFGGKDKPENLIFIAGWGNRASEGHWIGFENLYKPVIDAGHGYIDALNDHDYGGHPNRMCSNYEVLNAYSVSRYNKPLTFYNTECAPNFDPAALGNVGGVQNKSAAHRQKMNWVTRKILHALQNTPDKSRNFSHFGVGGGFWEDQGEGIALKVMKNLRGRLLVVNCDDPKVLVAAAVDGTDPLNPRPEEMGAGPELSLNVFNDHRESRKIAITVQAPEGTTFVEAIHRYPQLKDNRFVIDEKKLQSQSEELRCEIEVPGHDYFNITLPLKGELATEPDVQRSQFISDIILQKVKSDIKTTLAIPSKALASARSAELKMVVERLAPGEGKVSINGHAMTLPPMVTPENTALILNMPLDPQLLKEKNELTFSVTAPERAGYKICMASIVVDSE